jgi:hypothetical protein
VNQAVFGSRGILRPSDYFRKQREFETWLRETRGIGEWHGPKGELMELFSCYSEDYNTCTLAHEKYYDLEAWEAAEMRREAAAGGAGRPAAAVNVLADEAARRAESKAAARQRELERTALYLASMDRDKVAAMKAQEGLRLAMQYAFKAGNVKEAERLQRLLNPEEK